MCLALVRNYFPLLEKPVSILGVCLSPHGIKTTRMVVILQDSLGKEERYTEDGFGQSWWSQHRAASLVKSCGRLSETTIELLRSILERIKRP